MKDFGFKPVRPNVIDLAPVQSRSWTDSLGLHPEMRSCISCGACAAVCPNNNELTKMSVRRTIIELRHGLPLTSEWQNCQMCNRCSLVCPKGLNTRSIFFRLNTFEALNDHSQTNAEPTNRK